MKITKGLEIKEEMIRNGNVKALGDKLKSLVITKKEKKNIFDSGIVSHMTFSRITNDKYYSCSRNMIINIILNLATNKVIKIEEINDYLKIAGVKLSDSISVDKKLNQELNEHFEKTKTLFYSDYTNYKEQKLDFIRELMYLYQEKNDYNLSQNTNNNISTTIISDLVEKFNISPNQIHTHTYISKQDLSKIKKKLKSNYKVYTINRAMAAGIITDLHINLGIKAEICEKIFEEFGYFLRRDDSQDKSLCNVLNTATIQSECISGKKYI